MKAQIWVEVENPGQSRAIESGLLRPDVRDFVAMMGALKDLAHDVARLRILTWLTDYAADPENNRVNRFAPIGKRE